jgi:hypothetical protein
LGRLLNDRRRHAAGASGGFSGRRGVTVQGRHLASFVSIHREFLLS